MHVWREIVKIISSFTQRYNGRHYTNISLLHFMFLTTNNKVIGRCAVNDPKALCTRPKAEGNSAFGHSQQ